MEQLKIGKKVVGIKQTLKAVSRNDAIRVYVAEDAEAIVTQPLVDLCKESNTEVLAVPSMKELAKVCHVEVPAACAALLKN